jgi:hypothetical protein
MSLARPPFFDSGFLELAPYKTRMTTTFEASWTKSQSLRSRNLSTSIRPPNPAAQRPVTALKAIVLRSLSHIPKIPLCNSLRHEG